jgi:hypothetical protein
LDNAAIEIPHVCIGQGDLLPNRCCVTIDRLLRGDPML